MLNKDSLEKFICLHEAATESVYTQLSEELGSAYSADEFNCRMDVDFTLHLVRSVLEFNILQPFIDYLHWLSNVYTTRGLSEKHLRLLLDYASEFYLTHIPGLPGSEISKVFLMGKTSLSHLADPQKTNEVDLKMPSAWKESEAFKTALLCGDSQRAQELFDSCIQGDTSILDVELHLVQPALYQIGRDWQANIISVAQEHLATSTAITVMAHAFSMTEPVMPNGKKALFACVQGNEHDVGLRIVADAFELRGWEVTLLGANTLADDLIEQVLSICPDLVGLSLAFPHHLQIVHNTIAQLRKQLGHNCPAIMVGGLAVNAYEQVTPILGADVAAVDANDAVYKSELPDEPIKH